MQEEYGEDRDYKEAFREVEKEEEGQCIWAFVNGVDNTKTEALQSAHTISKHANGEKIWSLVNDKSWLKNYDQAVVQKLRYSTEAIRFGTRFLQFLLEQSKKRTGKPPVVVFAHSEGAMIYRSGVEWANPSRTQSCACIYVWWHRVYNTG